jgi:hypothetical protein
MPKASCSPPDHRAGEPSKAPLSPSERKHVRELIETRGEVEAAAALHSNRYTILRAAAGLPQSRAVRLLMTTRLLALEGEAR